jgi:integrase
MTRRRPAQPVLDDAPGLRQRLRADGTWRVWWEPTAAARKAGAQVIDLSAMRSGDAARTARAEHDKWARVVAGDAPKPQHQGRTITDLILDYQHSLDFTRKPASTRRVYGSDLRAIEGKWGAQPALLFTKPALALWHEALVKDRGETRARAILRMMSILMGHAELRGWRAENTNPCTGLKLRTPVERSRAADWDEFDALIAAARRLRARPVLVALHLAVLAGQRQYDILRTQPDDFYMINAPHMARPVWVWALKQSKRGKVVEVPVHPMAVPPLRLQLMRAPTGPGTLIWDEATGKAFTPDRFAKLWAKVRADAATTMPSVATLQWRDLRRTFGNLSRAGGSSDADTADVLGNTAAKNPKLRRTYMAPQLITTLRAVSAVQRPERKGKTG